MNRSELKVVVSNQLVFVSWTLRNRNPPSIEKLARQVRCPLTESLVICMTPAPTEKCRKDTAYSSRSPAAKGRLADCGSARFAGTRTSVVSQRELSAFIVDETASTEK